MKKITILGLFFILVAGISLALTTEAQANENIEIKAGASNAAGDQLDIDVRGSAFNMLTGTAKFTSALGVETFFVIDESNISGFIITLKDLFTNDQIEIRLIDPTEVLVDNGGSTFFTLGTDKLGLDLIFE